jgi:hypothetical protein
VIREFEALLNGLSRLVTVREKEVLAEQPLAQRAVHVILATMVVSAVVPVDAHVLLPTLVLQVRAGVG